jgi:hypothetical protein
MADGIDYTVKKTDICLDHALGFSILTVSKKYTEAKCK